MTPPIDELIACVEREIALRKRVLPKQVERRRMRMETAQREIELMVQIHALLVNVKHTGRVPPGFEKEAA